jgi:uncharacterized protein (DUF2147 family)
VKKALILILSVFASTPAWAAHPAGYWRLPDGSASVLIRVCGMSLCGSSNDGSFYGSMRFTGWNAWTGSISDLRTSNVYDAKATLLNPDALKIHACLRGTTMCGDQTWTRGASPMISSRSLGNKASPG